MANQIGINLEVDSAEVDRILSALNAIPGATIRAAQRAGSKTLTSARSQVAKHVAAESNLLQKVVRQRIFLRRPTRKNLGGQLWLGLRPIGAQNIGPAMRLAKGFRFGSGKTGRVYPSAFSATMDSGITSVWQREGKSKSRSKGRPLTSPPNLPIYEPSVELKANPYFVVKDINQRYLTIMAQEVNFEIQKAAGKIKR